MNDGKPKHPDLRRRSIIAQAERLLEEEGLNSLPVDLDALAATRDIDIQAKQDAAKGVSGMLLRYGDSFGILYATHIPSIGYQRFSIAHEMGHYFLEGHAEKLLPHSDSVHQSRAGFASEDPIEREADYFASGLLMPTSLFQKEIRRHDDGLDAIIRLSELCLSSLTATAIRYADLTRGAVAVIVSGGTTVEFAFLSEGIKALKDIRWLRKGAPIPKTSLTARFNADPTRFGSAASDSDDVDISDWLGGKSVRGKEEVQGLGGYGRSLTVLTCTVPDETYGDDEDEEEESLIESWTPRFHKR
jgi:Zn-dependent peptidase ImmA (M78 family)